MSPRAQPPRMTKDREASAEWLVPTEEIMSRWSPPESVAALDLGAASGAGAAPKAAGVMALYGSPLGSGDEERIQARATTIEQSSREIDASVFLTLKPPELRLSRVLGKGARATVYKAALTQPGATHLSVAVKRLHDCRDSARPELCRHRETLATSTEHPNLLRCFDVTLNAPYFVVMEYCAGRSLFDILYNTETVITLKQSTKILMDVASGMRYLHEQQPRILHGDLKSSNVLLAHAISGMEQEPLAKVADFALARTMPSENATAGSSWLRMSEGIGFWRWMAPELFELDDTVYDGPCDVFSYAMVMYETLLRKLPYADEFPEMDMDPRISIHIALGLRPDVTKESMPETLATQMRQAWSDSPEDRPTFVQLEHALKAQHVSLNGTTLPVSSEDRDNVHWALSIPSAAPGTASAESKDPRSSVQMGCGHCSPRGARRAAGTFPLPAPSRIKLLPVNTW